MSEIQSIRLLSLFLGISLLIQTMEFFRIQHEMKDKGVWVWSVLRKELPLNPRWLGRFFDFIFQDRAHFLHLCARLLGVLFLLTEGSNIYLMAFLFFSTISLLFRFRGAFNGGSDFLSLVVITGLLLAEVCHWISPGVWGYKAGLWYITLHTVSSYFISGWVKLKRREWRDGSALVVFLDGGIYGPLSLKSVFRYRSVAVLCSWSFIVWEGVAPLLLLSADVAWVYCCIAALFHFFVFWFFGLNRFFWAWCTSFPALIYCAGRLPI
jgi:hypothetical protein